MENKINNPNPLSGVINKKVPDKGFRFLTAFTLVELIVVITILAILATVGFVSFSGYLAGTRDVNRVSQLKSMSDALELYRTKKDLPLPDTRVEIRTSDSSSDVIAYQGYIGKNVLETIEYTESGLDPKDKQYFSYYLTKNKKYFQLMAFLEEENEDIVALNLNKVGAIDYSDRKAFVKGKKLGIITDEFNTPIQEVEAVTSSGYLDIVNTDEIYNIYFSGESLLTGTGKTLKGAVGGRGLVGYWSFDEIVDNSFVDYSENSATGTITGGVTLTSGQSGKSAVFDGTDGEFYVDLIKNIGGNSSAPHTISAWIKPDSIPGGTDNSTRQWILLLGNIDLDNISSTGPGTHHWLIGGSDYQHNFEFGVDLRNHLI
ncbi:MAG: prepilin-type N-terminal cleavage/methylation domain-containing protein [Candidatus Gracilibacteria bacterium]|nr:prepilin-type N-terminal cleavage/methylation domain-containing protein [Candidatus Gracilibacteria bacterium]